MTIIGIDPGKSGGIAWHDGDSMQCAKMPETLTDIWTLLRDIHRAASGSLHAYLELVHARPKQGVSSMFTFGEGYGALQMALIAWEIPFERVTPRKWQGALSCLTGGDKNVSKARAQELFPKLKITHATADALLIAEYGRRKQTQPT